MRLGSTFIDGQMWAATQRANQAAASASVTAVSAHRAIWQMRSAMVALKWELAMIPCPSSGRFRGTLTLADVGFQRQANCTLSDYELYAVEPSSRPREM